MLAPATSTNMLTLNPANMAPAPEITRSTHAALAAGAAQLLPQQTFGPQHSFVAEHSPALALTPNPYPCLYSPCFEHACSNVRAPSDFKGLRAAEKAVTVSQVMQYAMGTPRQNRLVQEKHMLPKQPSPRLAL